MIVTEDVVVDVHPGTKLHKKFSVFNLAVKYRYLFCFSILINKFRTKLCNVLCLLAIFFQKVAVNS